jgi:class 3 adenylate cyclase
MATQTAVIVLADIGGYTRFMKKQETALVHAEAVITDLLNSVIDNAEHPLTLNKLEGDAVLFFALATPDNLATVAKSALQQVNGFFKAFEQRKQEMSRDVRCNCGACESIHTLSIKGVLHCGEVVLRKVRRFEELSGTSVITAHRLMKNHVPLTEYILATEEFAQVSGGLPGQTGTPLVEDCEGIGRVNVVYYAPDPTIMAPPVPRNLGRQMKMMATMMVFLVRHKLGLLPAREFHNLSAASDSPAKST